jgi:hypothetical protein
LPTLYVVCLPITCMQACVTNYFTYHLPVASIPGY